MSDSVNDTSAATMEHIDTIRVLHHSGPVPGMTLGHGEATALLLVPEPTVRRGVDRLVAGQADALVSDDLGLVSNKLLEQINRARACRIECVERKLVSSETAKSRVVRTVLSGKLYQPRWID